jgi:hypothetical protein
MNLGQTYSLASRAPILDLWLKITKSWKFVIHGFIWFTKFWSPIPTLLQAKMAQQGKQLRVGAQEGCRYHPVKLVLLANGNMYEVDSSTFSSGKALYPLWVLLSPNSDLFWHTFTSVVCDSNGNFLVISCTSRQSWKGEHSRVLREEAKVYPFHWNSDLHILRQIVSSLYP